MLDELRTQRLEQWRQTPQRRIHGSDEAAHLINVLGIVTLFPASPEVANLFHAYMGNPTAQTSPQWDSPSGQVYGWRWELGRQEAGFYTAIVRNRPTWVSWELLPAVLRLRAELRMPDELFDLGELSDNAYRIARALEAAGGVLSTGELRRAAGFPTGKDHRAAYLKAVDELDTRLLLAKVFSQESEDMSHALVRVRFRTHVDAADAMAGADAMDRFLRAYLAGACYAAPVPLAIHLKLPRPGLLDGLRRLTEQGHAERNVGTKGGPVRLESVKHSPM